MRRRQCEVQHDEGGLLLSRLCQSGYTLRRALHLETCLGQTEGEHIDYVLLIIDNQNGFAFV